MKKAYLETIALVERLHRECLEVIKADLDRQGIRDLNNVQAMILFNIGEDVLSVGELTNRGYYLGSNVSYNVKKMVENGYLVQERSPHDRRAVHVKLSPKAQAVCQKMHEMYDRHVRSMTEVAAAVHYVCMLPGGRGAFREVAELLIEARTGSS